MNATHDGSLEPAFTVQQSEAGRLLFAKPWTFLRGVTRIDDLPPAGAPEIAFAGRSNVGKSSLINALVNQRALARTSNTPGRTQELNFFHVNAEADANPALLMVDMPGYGYAEAPKDKVDIWTQLIRDYLRGRASLARVFLLIDSRHGVKPVDESIMALLDESAVSYQAVLTKLDKLKPSDRERIITATQTRMRRRPAAFPVVLATSAEKGIGIAELRATIAEIMTTFGSNASNS